MLFFNLPDTKTERAREMEIDKKRRENKTKFVRRASQTEFERARARALVSNGQNVGPHWPTGNVPVFLSLSAFVL